MNAKLSFFFLFLIVLSCYASASDVVTWSSVVFNDSFGYADAFSLHGWSVQSITAPINSPFSTNAIGLNQTVVADDLDYIRRVIFSPNANHSTLIFRFNASYQKDNDTAGNTPMTFKIYRHKTTDYNDYFNFYINYQGSNLSVINFLAGWNDSGTGCSFETSKPHSAQYTIVVDINQSLYTVFKDKVAVCLNYDFYNRNGGFLNISSAGFLLGREGGERIEAYFDDFMAGYGSMDTSNLSCSYPIIFCDNFDYSVPVSTKGWLAYTGAFTIDNSFTPTDDILFLDSSYHKMFHGIAPFKINRYIATDVLVNSGLYASHFSSEFEFNLSFGSFSYLTEDYIYGYDVYRLKALIEGSHVNYLMRIGSNDIEVCHNCSAASNWTSIKITSSFSQREKMPFNSSFLDDSVDIFIDGNLVNTTYGFIEPLTQNQNKHSIIKESGSILSIENYYVYVGSDKYTDTLQYTQTDIFTEEDTSIVSDSGDLSTNIESLWALIGLKTQRSRIIFSLFIILILDILIISYMIQASLAITPVPFIIIDFIVMLIEVYTRLLPLWIPVIFLILSSGLAAFSIKRVSE